ncbi:uncharacterized protein BDZ99DRAFT_568903 [Mytilinidion resinicola]|uniref:Uncharacterized protein n=1 Tax=Mytilinidion resinicola TaxID=574789 RepID=A0A6A6YW95_9PEZI|nr:uncharacterized protein BDZ99DRAFT_568903 [Mytilinidion resinicola]KAF2812167.1 hypothetical protein BDZ99DRAFT_568903 [Mytilinidion resinicola]
MSTSTSAVAGASREITPPPAQPPTPPAGNEKFQFVDQIVQWIEQIDEGTHSHKEAWTQFQFVEGEFDELQRRLESSESWGFYQDKIRDEYDTQTREYAVRRPTNIGESFIRRLDTELYRWRSDLCTHAASETVQKFASAIIDIGHATITLRDGTYFSPDIQCARKGDRIPSIIIEVAYKQPPKNLEKMAVKYLLRSNESVQVVVGIDLKDEATRTATISVWRRQLIDDELVVTAELKDQEIRDNTGSPTANEPLRIRLRDFAKDETCDIELGSEDAEFVMTMAQLCEMLNKVEEVEAQLRALQEAKEPMPRMEIRGYIVNGMRLSREEYLAREERLYGPQGEYSNAGNC